VRPDAPAGGGCFGGFVLRVLAKTTFLSVPMETTSDAVGRDDLLRAVQLGDPSALPALLDAEDAYLRARVQRLLGPPLSTVMEVDDVLQEIRLRILRTDGVRFESLERLRAWFAVVARTCIVDLHRRHFRTVRRPPVPRSIEEPSTAAGVTIGMGLTVEQSGPSSVARHGEEQVLLRRILTDLRPDQRRLLERVHFEHQLLAEIAMQDGCSSSAVRMRYKRALEACRRRMNRMRNAESA